MDPRVPGQLVGSGEALGAALELAGVRLLAGMGSNVSGLVLEAVEGLVAERALVGTGEIWSLLAVVSLTTDHLGHHADGSHFGFLLLLSGNLGELCLCGLLLLLQEGLWVQ
jgi:hypothetical protein